VTIPPGQAGAAALCIAETGAGTPVETHVSAVFVGRDRVLKLRKAVRLPFLDQTEPARRDALAAREIALNAPHAPGLYRGLRRITRAADGSLALDGAGEPVETLVEMAPIPPGDFLDAVAAAGGLDAALLDTLGDAVAALHAAAPRAAAGHDEVARFAHVLDGNLDSALAAGLDAATARAWHGAARARLALLAPLLAARAAAGFVRRCHGDLHLGNLALWQGRPVPFDALEFDEALATTDTGHDLAFLLMDLDLRAGRAAANRVFARYVARSGDAGLCAGLALWLSTRAMVRAHVAAAAGRDGARYLAFAQAVLRPVPPRLVAVGGVTGTGKTRLARRLAPLLGAAPGALHLRSDEIRKRQHGAAPETRLPPEAYTPEASARVHDELVRMAGVALSAGHSVVADAMFLDPAMRAAVEAAAGAARFDGLWLTAPPDVLEARVAARRGDASDADAAVLRRVLAAHPGPLSWHVLDATLDAEPGARAALGLAPVGRSAATL
jgi:aminoglycoside phosphotransferase family enzyme/predicted kinase